MYSGLTTEELVGTKLMAPQTCSASTDDALKAYAADGSILPSSFDWRKMNIVTSPKDQKECASSWAFAAAGALESHWSLYSKINLLPCRNNSSLTAHKPLEIMVALVDFPHPASEYIKHAKGLNSENSYPYESLEGSCQFNDGNIGAKIYFGSNNITAGDEEAITKFLVERGPVSVVFNVAQDFFSYQSGVYSSSQCSNSPNDVNHAALLVGYGYDQDSGMDYWIAKNSWGRYWGEEGYFRIQKGVNMCGLADCASFPSIIGI
eukprot:CAMPEP_0114600570 /NCGR_PEP_ID=MMETSP0125-20121206/23168_1 /TAXON_ID=485358 ORGANISM="Aristerostoma sp., Strain ATCC 50986" /NCGR_SAMPLE_ID=MMETSP0125 /ASSEMBLY_ACC=CAM_ASM_000245 /LENGTH=262 /DNA_ID=CAMNT_0001808889 /DNA_START=320 /DNA_END=1108 /DNA_ORIENTATION=-